MDKDSHHRSEEIITGLAGWTTKIRDLVVLVFSLISSAIAFISTRQWGEIVAGILSVIIVFAAISWIFYRHRKNKQKKLITDSEDSAFKGLLSFEESDAEYFFGRGIDVGELVQRVRHSDFRFGVLTGESGCGKTSLIKAGLIPRLRREGYFPVYVRLYRDPAAMIRQAVDRAVQKGSQEKPEIDSENIQDLNPYLRRVSEAIGKPLVLCCDQFEEFFIRFPTEKSRAPFIRIVADCFHDLDLPVKFLFALREDFLIRISEFDGHIPNPLDIHKRYHLKTLDTDQAAEIIQRCVDRAQVPFDPALCRMVAQDLAVKERVLPTELQIVCQQMQFHHIFSADKYRASGGKESLVYGFVEEVIKGAGTESEVKLVLRSMISEENTKLALTLGEISLRCQKNKDRVRSILETFVGARLIREIQDEEPWRYEFMHEYLIDKINAISGSVMDANKRANLAFRQWLIKYDIDKKTRIPLTEWRFISRYSDLKRNSKERALLSLSLRSAMVRYGTLSTIVAGFLAVAVYDGIEQREQIQQQKCKVGKLVVNNPVKAKLKLMRVRIFKKKTETCSGFDSRVLKEDEIHLEGPGDYTLIAEKDGWTVKYPVNIDSYGHAVQIKVTRPPTKKEIPEGMVFIPAGEFKIGNKDKTDGIRSDAIPHKVKLDGFFMDKTEVTNQAFAQFMAAGGYDNPDFWSEGGIKFLAHLDPKQPRYWNDDRFNDPDQPGRRPVVGVNWYEASAYCRWRGKHFRLPTEAEWEKAARGPEGYTWSFGNTLANVKENANGSGSEDGYEYTAPVGSYKPSSYGLHDMSGNVWEWVEDWYSRQFYQQQENIVVNPVNNEGDNIRVNRGGSWVNASGDLRASVRFGFDPSHGGGSLGFRCARTL